MVLLEGIFTYFQAPAESVLNLGSELTPSSVLFSSLPVVIYLKYSVIILILAAVAYPYWKARRRYVALIDQIPGPPVEPWFPFLGHALLVLHLDRANFQYGTYACECELFYSGVLSIPYFRH